MEQFWYWSIEKMVKMKMIWCQICQGGLDVTPIMVCVIRRF